MQFIRLLALGVASAFLSGCATPIATPYAPHFETLDTLKTNSFEKVSVGTVQPIDPQAPVNLIRLRALNLESPYGTFSKYLENALIQDLKELSAYDPAAKTKIDATLLKNNIDISGFSTGEGIMEVDLKVTREQETRLQKVYKVSTQFPSSFAGAVAIPRGQIEYANLVRTLLREIYSDSEFIKAIKK